MTQDEFRCYWIPARDSGLFGPPSTWGFSVGEGPLSRAHKLKALLGLDMKARSMDHELTDKLRSQLMALAGPHGATIKRALELTNGSR